MRLTPDGFKITGRERQILMLVSQNLTSKQIALQLFLSTRTVDSHCYKICRKLNASDRFEAVILARQRGLI